MPRATQHVVADGVDPAGAVDPDVPVADRADGLLARTRRLFLVAALVSLGFTLPAPLVGGSGAGVVLALAGAAVVATSSVLRYRRRRPWWGHDAAEALGVAAFSAACSQPAVGFGFAFALLWFRSVHGSTREMVVYAGGLAGGLLAAVPLWSAVPGHEGSTPAEPILGALPVMLVTAGVARYLAVELIAREQAQRRDAALARLGGNLLGVTEREVVYAHAWRATEEICRASPGLRVLAVARDDDDHPHVRGQTAGWRHEPVHLPDTVSLPRRVTDVPADLAAALDEAAGVRCAWALVPLPDQPEGDLVVGAPGQVPQDVLVALRSMTSQVALACRAGDAHADLARQASTDGLTALANRTSFTAALARALQDEPGTALLFIDLDDFKVVNDGRGHVVGDELLREVATRLAGAVRPGDACARLGGDEFGVLLTGVDEAAALEVAHDVVAALGQGFRLRGASVSLGASVGVAMADDGVDAIGLVQRADVAMYAAKAAGKGRVQLFGTDLLRPDAEARFHAELAAAAPLGQVVVHYQPVLDARDGRCTAVEALVRWQHPERGLLAPGHFVAAAERSGAVVAIGAAVLEAACDFAGALDDAGHESVTVHVNVSAVQLTHPGFYDLVADCLVRHGMVPGRLCLEVTESMVLDDPGIADRLHSLVDLGVRVAIDDFGTGYSALTTLTTLPLHTVKIDRSFVTGLPDDTRGSTVVDAIVDLAHRLGLRAVAEGVERPEQQDALRRAGVDAVQGFLHRRPGTDAEVLRWLAARTAAPVTAPLALVRQRTG
ncbi:putative bifunctional diguanylate cyclase/phosphodiesterase [Aquipuribacter sp. SD81]|uniref:putative bifunctional diguanylate cyclase/phosphodiesterase n=1 Tax=Aquipuribacter sp. SD81 TaxID=3127703 RepID=UPI003015B305